MPKKLTLYLAITPEVWALVQANGELYPSSKMFYWIRRDICVRGDDIVVRVVADKDSVSKETESNIVFVRLTKTIPLKNITIAPQRGRPPLPAKQLQRSVGSTFAPQVVKWLSRIGKGKPGTGLHKLVLREFNKAQENKS